MASAKTTKALALTLATAIVASAVSPLSSAEAGHKHRHHRHHDNSGAIIGAGIIGLTLGAIVAGSNDNRRYRADRVYRNYHPAPPPQVIYDPRPLPQLPPNYVHPRARDNYYVPPRSAPNQQVYVPPRNFDRGYELPERERRIRDQPPKVITYDEAVNNNPSTEPWSPGWYSYCRAKFRSFNSKTGTFLGYDGKRHFCVVR